MGQNYCDAPQSSQSVLFVSIVSAFDLMILCSLDPELTSIIFQYSHYKMKIERDQESRSLEDVLGTDLEILTRKNFTVAADDPFPRTIHGRDLKKKARFFKAKSLVYRGLYADQLKEWLQYYTLNENLLVIRYERLNQEPTKVLKEILDFLGAPEFEFPAEAFGQSYSPVIWSESHNELVLSNETRTYLQRFYKPYNDELADLLGEEWRGVWDEGWY